MKTVDLTLLKRFVQELEFCLLEADKYKDVDDTGVEHIVQLSKAIGVASAISQEAILLTTDIAKSSKTLSPKFDTSLDDIFGLKKGVKN